MKIQIKSRSKKVLFEHEQENNTIKRTLELAIKRNADLWNADLRNADLRGAYLRNADLWNADLRNADLSGAYLRNADLWNADLRGADLSGANFRNAKLRNANLENADLRSAYLENADLENADLGSAIKIPMYCKWSFGITDNKIHIGCKKKTIKEWDRFFKSIEIFETNRKTNEFKQIEAVYSGLKAYYNHLNK